MAIGHSIVLNLDYIRETLNKGEELWEVGLWVSYQRY